MIQIVALLKIKDPDAFISFEKQAVEIMARYDGHITHAFKPVADGDPADDGDSENRVDEVHILEFPDSKAFEKYKTDNTLLALSELRSQAIAGTKLYVSHKSVDYSGRSYSVTKP